MTKNEILKKIGLQKADDDNGGNSSKIKDQVSKYLKEGKNRLLLLERQVKGGKNYKNLQDGINRSKEKLQEAKKNFEDYEKKAEQYIEKNPKKAVAMAAAAGALAGSLWAALKTKKPVLKKKK